MKTVELYARLRHAVRIEGITGSEKEGSDQLGNFLDPESKYPVLVTTSRLCPDLPPDRARSGGGLDDRVQANRWARHSLPATCRSRVRYFRTIN